MLFLVLLSVWYFFLLRGIAFLLGEDKGLVLSETGGVLKGMGALALLLYGWHFIGPSSFWLLVPLGLVAGFGWWKKGKDWLRSRYEEFKAQSRLDIGLGLVFFLLPLFFAVQRSTVPDEGLYYAQSILWFENFGWVRGLANFDYFLGQGSSLHALESLLHFERGDFRTNDLAAFLVALLSVELFWKRKKLGLGFTLAYLAGIYLMAGLLTADNTDLILLVALPVLFHGETVELKSYFLIIAFMALVKTSGLIFLLMLLPLVKKRPWSVLIIGGTIVMLVAFKSWWLTGFPLFPFHSGQFTAVSWEIPRASFGMQSQFGLLQASTYLGDLPAERGTFFLQKQMIIGQMRLESVFAWVYLLISLFVGYILFRKHKWSWAVLFLGYALIWFFLAPQPRLAFPFFVFELAFLLGLIYRGKSNWFYLTPFAVPVFLVSSSFGNALFYPDWKDGKSSIIPENVWAKEDIESRTMEVNNLEFCQVSKRAYCYYACFPCQAHIYQDYLVRDSLYLARPLGASFKDGFGYEVVPYDERLLEEFNSWDYGRQREYLGIE